MSTEQYLILCTDAYCGDACIWWRPNRSGYTYDIDQAGRYSKEEALGIETIRGTDVAVPESELHTRIQPQRVVTWEVGQNAGALKQHRAAADARYKAARQRHGGAS